VLGYAELGLGRTGSALRYLQDSLVLHRQVGNRYPEADTLYHIAAVHRLCGRRTQAIEDARTALALASETGERRAEAGSLAVLATLVAPKQAAELCRRALRLARDTKARLFEVEALLGLATASRDMHQYEPALGYATHAHDISSESGYRMLEGRALTALASIYLAMGDHERAAAQARRALAIHRQTGHRVGQTEALGVLGEAEQAAGEPDAAERHWREARDIAAACGVELSAVGVPDRDCAGVVNPTV
jgi:tetratricopeptide (TPR) repeat protein